MYRALYLPRCLPDGDVVVDSFQFRIFPLNSAAVISYGKLSSSEVILQKSRSDRHWGGRSKVFSCSVAWGVDCRISSDKGVSADQEMWVLRGGKVNGVPWDCPKCFLLRNLT